MINIIVTGFKIFVENDIRLMSSDSFGNIKFLAGNVVYTYHSGDGYLIKQYVDKYRYKPGKLFSLIAKMNFPFKKEVL